eukprot:CAMPEP_0175126352 /NCGR_PEP_ID=MMETSP0087-20121206/3801_1 /TAXON_ID=136419 /ORGANISM="Unknown Unknown, Strain D1" /LENGTH=963 /DNA_ID=CAMNT_0016408245 /DNA_START=44 /DNA_END=2932 /DNA_ORIENTATION=-
MDSVLSLMDSMDSVTPRDPAVLQVDLPGVALPADPATAAANAAATQASSLGTKLLFTSLGVGLCTAGYLGYSIYQKHLQLTQSSVTAKPVPKKGKSYTQGIKDVVADLVVGLSRSTPRSKEEEKERRTQIVGRKWMKREANLPESTEPLTRKSIVAKQKDLLQRFQKPVAGMPLDEDEKHLLHSTIEQLGERFLVVVVGEFNSGKSAFVNSLLGGHFVQEGILPTTDNVCKISYGQQEEVSRNPSLGYTQLKLPVPWLKDINIVDTPGTNALTELGHQAITERFLPQSDLVLFVTSAERPLTESERQVIKKIKEWNRKVVVVVNKCDMFGSDQERQHVLAYVKCSIDEIWPGNEVELYGVSAKQALGAKLQSVNPNAPWEQLFALSNLGSVEKYIFHSLDAEQKLKWKLQKPLTVVDRFCAKFTAALQDKRGVLEQEIRLLKRVDSVVEEHHTSLFNDFSSIHAAQLEQSFERLLERANSFVDHHVNFMSLSFLLQPAAVQSTFREEVCVDFQAEIEALASRLTDWLTERRSRVLERVHAELSALHLHSHRAEPRSELFRDCVQPPPALLEDSHQMKLAEFRRHCKNTISKFSSEEIHSRELVDSVRMSLYQMTALEVSALSSGMLFYNSLLTWLTKRQATGAVQQAWEFLAGQTTSLANEMARPLPLLGLLASTGLLAALGVNVMRFRRHQVKRNLQREKEVIRQRLAQKFSHFVEEKVNTCVQEMVMWLEPFLSAVKAEEKFLENLKADIERCMDETHHLDRLIVQVASESSTTVQDALSESQPIAYPTAAPLSIAGPNSYAALSKYTYSEPAYQAVYPTSQAQAYPSLQRNPSLPTPYSPSAPSSIPPAPAPLERAGSFPQYTPVGAYSHPPVMAAPASYITPSGAYPSLAHQPGLADRAIHSSSAAQSTPLAEAVHTPVAIAVEDSEPETCELEDADYERVDKEKEEEEEEEEEEQKQK